MFDNIKSDLKRLYNTNGNVSKRSLISGVLSQGFQAVIAYRFFSWCFRNGIPAQPFRFFIERFIEITTGISIPASCKIGKGLRIHHFGGIIFHPSVEIGENATIYHDTTIGDRGGTGNAAKIGNNVMMGAGAKIIGEIIIGDNCVVGANAVVNKNMPDNTVAFGNPAQYKSKESKSETE